MTRTCLLIVMVSMLVLAGCGGGDGDGGGGERGMPPSIGDRNGDGDGMMPEGPEGGGRAAHRLGTWLEYATTSDGMRFVTMTFEEHVYHTRPEEDEGRWMLLVSLDVPEDAPDLVEDDPCHGQAYHYWDLATGNWAACLDGNKMLIGEKAPHDGRIPLSMQAADTWTVESCWYDHSDPPPPGCYAAEEYFTVAECGIQLEVIAGTFTTCRIVLTGASYSPWLHDIIWYAPAENLLVKRDFGGGAGVVYELSDYELVE